MGVLFKKQLVVRCTPSEDKGSFKCAGFRDKEKVAYIEGRISETGNFEYTGNIEGTSEDIQQLTSAIATKVKVSKANFRKNNDIGPLDLGN